MCRLKIVFLVSVLFLSGCATSEYSSGRDFSGENVPQIAKGETTAQQVVSLFGEPYSKTVTSSTDEVWTYMYVTGSAKVQSYIVSAKVRSTSQSKMLSIILTNGKVSNFTYTNGQPTSINVN